MSEATEKYKHCNHHHKLTDEYCIVDFGDGEFVANKKAVPLLKALNEIGLRTRTHHIDDNGGFFSIILSDDMDISVRTIAEASCSRTKYNGEKEVLVSWNTRAP